MNIKQSFVSVIIATLFTTTLAWADPVKRFQPGDKTIAEIATSMPETFSTLVAALTCTDLVGAVSDPEAELTVFAPTNDAFAGAGLNAGNICDLDKETLTEILLYHVTGERRPSPSVINGRNKSIEMLAGGSIYPEGRTSLNIDDNTGETVSIAVADVLASNGIVHVISGVLMPF